MTIDRGKSLFSDNEVKGKLMTLTFAHEHMKNNDLKWSSKSHLFIKQLDEPEHFMQLTNILLSR